MNDLEQMRVDVIKKIEAVFPTNPKIKGVIDKISSDTENLSGEYLCTAVRNS
jgi:hypothetical protein